MDGEDAAAAARRTTRRREILTTALRRAPTIAPGGRCRASAGSRRRARAASYTHRRVQGLFDDRDVLRGTTVAVGANGLRRAKRFRKLLIRAIRLHQRRTQHDADATIAVEEGGGEPLDRNRRCVERVEIAEKNASVHLRVAPAEAVEVDQADRGSIDQPLRRMRRTMGGTAPTRGIPRMELFEASHDGGNRLGEPRHARDELAGTPPRAYQLGSAARDCRRANRCAGERRGGAADAPCQIVAAIAAKAFGGGPAGERGLRQGSGGPIPGERDCGRKLQLTF